MNPFKRILFCFLAGRRDASRRAHGEVAIIAILVSSALFVYALDPSGERDSSSELLLLAALVLGAIGLVLFFVVADTGADLMEKERRMIEELEKSKRP